MGREFIVEWTTLDENYDPKGASQQTSVKIYESSEGRVLAEDINLRLLEKSNRRVRLKVTTRSYPGAPHRASAKYYKRADGNGSSKQNHSCLF